MGERIVLTMAPLVMGVALMCILVTGSLSLEHSGGLQHPSGYHLTVLKRSINRIKRSWVKKSHVSKRDTDSQADDLLLNSFAAYCTHFQADSKIAKHFKQMSDKLPLSRQDISGFTKLKIDRNRDVRQPTAFPTNIWAQREKDIVWLVFEIAHSDTVIISRLDPFNYRQFVLEMPDNVACQKIVSKVRMAIDSPHSECRNAAGSGKWRERLVKFQMSTEADSQSITVLADICKYDKSFNYKYYYHGPIKPMRSESVSYPTFLITPDPGDVVVLEHSQDLIFNVHVNQSSSTQFSMDLSLWDWTSEKMLHSSARLTKDQKGIYDLVVDKTNSDNEDIFNVDSVNQTSDYPINVILRISLSGASRNRSGKLYLSYSDLYTGAYPYMSKIAKRVGLKRTVEIRMPGRPHALPDDLIYLIPQKRFLCDGNGNKQQGQDLDSDLGFQKNCTVRCQAFGPDMTSLYISKFEPTKSPIRSTSFVQQDRAVAILDVGPSSGDVEGDYQCVVVDKRGQTITQDIVLYTSLFTEMLLFDVTDYHQDTPRIKCSVSGDTSLNISITVSEADGNVTRLDSDARYEKNITRDGDVTAMSMDVPWTDLKYPKNILVCSAEGVRGNDRKEIILSRYPKYKHGVFVFVERNEFNVTRNENDSISYTCFASGLQPISMTLHVIDVWEPDPIKLDSHYTVTRTTQTHADRVSMTMTISPEYHRAEYVRCQARNRLSSDSDTFNLWQYLRYRG